MQDQSKFNHLFNLSMLALLLTVYGLSRAMKRDVTMNGIRTKKGVVQDAVSYLQRYYINNYRDKANQQDLNTILGVEGDDIEEDLAEDVDAVSSVDDDEDTDEGIDGGADLTEEDEDDDIEEMEETEVEESEKVDIDTGRSSSIEEKSHTESNKDDVKETRNTAYDTAAEESTSKSRFGDMLNKFFTSLHADLQEALENAAQSDI